MPTRRSFLATLGIAASGIAFRPSLDFLVPDNIVSYEGEPNLRWLLAEAVAALGANLPENQFRHVNQPSSLAEGRHQFGVNFRWNERLMTLSKKEIREQYIDPAMHALANEIRFRKAKTCFALDVPHAVEETARIYAPKHGLDLRFIRAWDSGAPPHSFTDRHGETVELLPRPAGWIARFDMLVA